MKPRMSEKQLRVSVTTSERGEMGNRNGHYQELSTKRSNMQMKKVERVMFVAAPDQQPVLKENR